LKILSVQFPKLALVVIVLQHARAAGRSTAFVLLWWGWSSRRIGPELLAKAVR